MSRLGSAAALVALLVGCAGRGPEPAPEARVAIDLIELVPVAERAGLPGRIDFGAGDDLVHLGGGFDRLEGEDPLIFRWNRGPSSTLIFDLARPERLEIAFRARPASLLVREGKGPLAVRFSVGDWQHEVALPEPGFQEVRLDGPELEAGRHELVIAYPRRARRGEIPGERRELAVAWDWLELEPEAKVRAENQTLWLPVGASLDFYLDLERGGELRHDGVHARGEVRATWSWETEQGDRAAGALSPGGVEGLAPGLGRLRLAVTAGEPGSGVRIDGPRVVARLSAEGGSDSVANPLAPARPDILLYVVDTLRADATALADPSLARLGGESVVFARARAQSSWTKAAMASVFTGLDPLSHGMQDLPDRLPAEVEVLAELLQQAGWKTGAFVGNAYLAPDFGFARGFDRFELLRDEHLEASALHEPFLEWWRRTPSPRFAWIHAIDPHAPYGDASGAEEGSGERMRELTRHPDQASVAQVHRLRKLYADEVAAADRQLGELLEALGPDLEATLFSFLSDHGEAFGEHGSFTHGVDLHRETVDVPWLIRFPGRRLAGLRVEEAVAQVDLLPTLLEAVGLEAPAVEGRSLLPGLWAGRVEPAPILSHLSYFQARQIALEDEGWKLIQPLPWRLATPARLYDRRRDPDEKVDRAADHPLRRGYYAARLRRALLEPGHRAEVAEIDAETERSLRALGYL